MPEAVRGYIRDRLMLFYTGLSRDAGATLAGQDKATRHNDRVTLASLKAIGALADPMAQALRAGASTTSAR